jgi:hypothetical protein
MKLLTLSQQEVNMEKKDVRVLPRWVFTLLAIGGAWASGIYLGKITIEGALTDLLIPTISFGLMAFLMAWGALAER